MTDIADINLPSPTPSRVGRRHRRRGPTSRDHRLTPRFTDEELATIRAAAEAAEMTLTGFCALAAPAVARHEPGDLPDITDDELAEMQRELYAAASRSTRPAPTSTRPSLSSTPPARRRSGWNTPWPSS